jgi:hypothetical protein
MHVLLATVTRRGGPSRGQQQYQRQQHRHAHRTRADTTLMALMARHSVLGYVP